MLTLVEKTIRDEYQSLYKLAYTYVKNQDDAMDVVQESVYKAIKSHNTLKNSSYVKAWLCQIVVNTALDLIRKNKREIVLEEFPEIPYEDKYSEFELLSILSSLDEKERKIIIFRYLEGLKIKDIAKALDENQNSIKSTLYRALKKLKNEI